MPALGGLWVGLGEFGCQPRVTDGWPVHVRERRRHVGRSVWNLRVPAEHSPGREGRGSEGKIRKARRTQPVTHRPLDQLLTQIGSKMSLKLPRNWDFHLKVEAAKIGKVRAQVFPGGSYARAPTICMLGCGSSVGQSTQATQRH